MGLGVWGAWAGQPLPLLFLLTAGIGAAATAGARAEVGFGVRGTAGLRGGRQGKPCALSLRETDRQAGCGSGHICKWRERAEAAGRRQAAAGDQGLPSVRQERHHCH